MINYKLTVIVPVYNVEHYIPKCLDSLINQTYENLEIICVNDGSTDNSLAVLQEYALKDSRIKLISTENRGLSAARNIGMDAATPSDSKDSANDLITFVDPDDYIELNTFSEALAAVSDDVDLVCFNFNRIDPNGRVLFQIHSNNLRLSGKYVVDVKIINSVLTSVTAKIFRKSIIKRNELSFPLGCFFEDNFFFPAYMLFCRNVYFIEKPFYQYVQRHDSIMGLTNACKPNSVIHYFYILNRLYQYMLNKGLFDKYNKVFWHYVFELVCSAFKYAADSDEINQIYLDTEKIIQNCQCEVIESERLRHFKTLVQRRDVIERNNYHFCGIWRVKHRLWYDKYYLLGIPLFARKVHDDSIEIKLLSLFKF